MLPLFAGTLAYFVLFCIIPVPLVKLFVVTKEILFSSREESKVVGVCVNTKKPATLDSSLEPTILFMVFFH